MPEFRVKVRKDITYEAEFVVKAESDDHVDLAVAAAIEADALAAKPQGIGYGTIEWELFDDSFEIIESSEA